MSLLDFHQDALSQIFCGTGIPDWVVVAPNTFPSPLAAAFDFADPYWYFCRVAVVWKATMCDRTVPNVAISRL